MAVADSRCQMGFIGDLELADSDSGLELTVSVSDLELADSTSDLKLTRQ